MTFQHVFQEFFSICGLKWAMTCSKQATSPGTRRRANRKRDGPEGTATGNPWTRSSSSNTSQVVGDVVGEPVHHVLTMAHIWHIMG